MKRIKVISKKYDNSYRDEYESYLYSEEVRQSSFFHFRERDTTIIVKMLGLRHPMVYLNVTLRKSGTTFGIFVSRPAIEYDLCPHMQASGAKRKRIGMG